MCISMKYTVFDELREQQLSKRRGSSKTESFGIAELEKKDFFDQDGVRFEMRPYTRVEYGDGRKSVYTPRTLVPVPSRSGNRYDFRFRAFNKKWSFNRVAGFLFARRTNKLVKDLTWEQFQRKIIVGKSKPYAWQVDHIDGPKLFARRHLEVVSRDENLRRATEKQKAMYAAERAARKAAERARKYPPKAKKASTRKRC